MCTILYELNKIRIIVFLMCEYYLLYYYCNSISYHLYIYIHVYHFISFVYDNNKIIKQNE